ncbi:MAG TPA: hypothetical protein VK508_15825 [Cyclobacteriaceae bacterium]|nr:hypothetical protein [Cyclobacteriaceae bacterium]
MKTISNFKKSLPTLLVLFMVSLASYAQQFSPQYFRHYDQRGVNVFETRKADSSTFDGVKLRIGANFTQGFQTLRHSNSARAILTSTGLPTLMETDPGSGSFVNQATGVAVPGIVQHPTIYGNYTNATNQLYINNNELFDLSNGFPLAQANLNLDVQLADGVRLNLVSYMSAHHHNEFWVKGGYIQVDKVGFLNSDFMDRVWKNVTLKVGHMEVNYGDSHFRRNDGGNTFYNPFIENNIMDAYSTEIGGELYWQKRGIIAMVGLTDGEIQGSVTKRNDRKPSIYGKLGYDKPFGELGRARITGSFYTTKSSISNTIYGGDRTGSNYQYVMEPMAATLTGNAFSGRVNPGFKDNVTALMINPFIKYAGVEFFGTWEMSRGNSQVENGEVQYSNSALGEVSKLSNRQFNQLEADLLYRFGKNQKFYLGAKYNTIKGTLAFGQSTTATSINQGTRGDVSINRTSVAAGWFITSNIMFKAEYVNQVYKDYPDTNILSGGKFNGLVLQGSIGF